MTTTTAKITQFEQDSARFYRRNFFAGLIHGIFFQMSAAFGSIHTVLPAFVTLLTPSTLAVGLMAAIQDFGEIIPQLFTAYLIEDKPRKKKYLLAVITVRWLSWGLLAWLTFQYGLSNPLLVLAVLIALFGLFNLAGGMGTVIYADIFARAIPANRRGRFTGARQIGGFALAILAGYVVKLILDNEAAFPFPTNYSLIFLLSTVTLAVAFTGFALIKEPVYPVRRKSESLRVMLRRALGLVRINANFRRLLVSRAILGVGVALAPFYVVHARQTVAADAGVIGLYLSAQMAGAALSNLLWGWLADTRGNKSVIIGTIASSGLASLLAVLLPALAPMAYALVFVLLGAMLSGLKLGFSNFILEMAAPEMRATCVALQNTLIAPITLLPLVAGFLIEGSSFGLVFGAQAALMVVGLAVSLKLLDPRTNQSGACIT
ncbi:MAG: hypothetical protein Kow0031_06680 [Anaerolineae bacterium]